MARNLPPHPLRAIQLFRCLDCFAIITYEGAGKPDWEHNCEDDVSPNVTRLQERADNESA